MVGYEIFVSPNLSFDLILDSCRQTDLSALQTEQETQKQHEHEQSACTAQRHCSRKVLATKIKKKRIANNLKSQVTPEKCPSSSEEC